MVPDVAGGHHEDHVLRNIGGVIADALEVPGNQDQIQGGLDGVGSWSM